MLCTGIIILLFRNSVHTKERVYVIRKVDANVAALYQIKQKKSQSTVQNAKLSLDGLQRRSNDKSDRMTSQIEWRDC